jgi:hypothetical protein
MYSRHIGWQHNPSANWTMCGLLACAQPANRGVPHVCQQHTSDALLA